MPALIITALLLREQRLLQLAPHLDDGYLRELRVLAMERKRQPHVVIADRVLDWVVVDGLDDETQIFSLLGNARMKCKPPNATDRCKR